jgi:(p)ppGpp synthase/HD superfamily hydrolase
MIEKAIQIAMNAHQGQVDKNGQPYILHVMRVGLRGRTENEKILGILHDVVEDSHWTLEMLAQEGFSAIILSALECLTKKTEDEPYEDFIDRVKKNELAISVKLNDLEDNMDIRRMHLIQEKDVKRLNKYLKAYKELAELKNL